jgi:Uma2 family endonuclease
MKYTETLVGVNFSPIQRRYTLEELWALPERADHAHYDLLGGFLFIVPPPVTPHGDIISRMNKSLIKFLFDREIDGVVRFPPEPICHRESATCLEPDFFYLSPSSHKLMTWHSSADIVFEVMTSATSIYDRTTKADTYLALGVKELWLIDSTSPTIEVRNAGKANETSIWKILTYSSGENAKSRVLEGYEVSVDDLFADLT